MVRCRPTPEKFPHDSSLVPGDLSPLYPHGRVAPFAAEENNIPGFCFSEKELHRCPSIGDAVRVRLRRIDPRPDLIDDFLRIFGVGIFIGDDDHVCEFGADFPDHGSLLPHSIPAAPREDEEASGFAFGYAAILC